MSVPKLFRGEMSITGRLLLWFLAIAFVPCGVLTGVIEYLASEALERTVHERLAVISEAKASALEGFAFERRGDAAVAARFPVVFQSFGRLSAVLRNEPPGSPVYRKESDPVRRALVVFQETYGYKNVYLISPEGAVLFQLADGLNTGPNLRDGPLKDTAMAQAFGLARTTLRPVFSDFQKYPGADEPTAFVAGPVVDEQGALVGVIELQIGNDVLYRIVNDSNGLGETGEAVAGVLRGDEVVVGAPLRFDPGAAFHRKVRVGSREMTSLQQAVKGGRGFGNETDYRGQRVVAAWTYVPTLRWGLVVKQDRREAYAMIDRQRVALGVLFVVTFGVVVVVALLVARSLSRPIREAVEVANRVAGGDLSAQVRVKAKGEAGKLLRAIQTMTQDLRSLIGRVQKSSIALLSTATEIAATARQQEQTVHEYGTSTNEAAAAVKEISATAQELLRTMNEVNKVAGDTAGLASHGQESLAGMDRTMRLLADSTVSIGSKLSVISERAANINLIVTTITKVADQTNLLSINAAIEAEKAGEYGLGFLVVAREIRRLADQTAVSTLDIERMVKEMQYSVSAGVMEMDKFSDQVRQGVREVANLSDQLGKIITEVQGLTDRFDQVTEGMRVQVQGADQIREAVVHLNEGVSQTLASIREFNQATAQLREAVGGLKDEVSRFRIDPAVV